MKDYKKRVAEYPSEINAPTPTNAINAMNQTLVKADSHAQKIDEYLS